MKKNIFSTGKSVLESNNLETVFREGIEDHCSSPGLEKCRTIVHIAWFTLLFLLI